MFAGFAFHKLLLVLSFAIVLVGCEDVDPDEAARTRFGDTDREGEISLWLTDGPVDDADRVSVAITAVHFKPVGEQVIHVALAQPLLIDLLAFDAFERRTRILTDHRLPAGEFEWLRLVFDETRLFIEIDGLQHPLTLTNDLSSQRIDLDLVVDEDAELDLTIDLDLRKSLFRLGGNQFDLRPSFRIVRTPDTGTLVGTVDRSLIENDRCANGILHDRGNAVFVFGGRNAALQDIRSDLNDPIATAPVSPHSATAQHEFRVDFLPRGDFTVVFTCDSSLDHPGIDNRLDVTFSEPFNVSIEAQTTSVLSIR